MKMIVAKYVYFECTIPEKNKQAFYELTVTRDLFGYTITRHWGRLGTKGQPKKVQHFSREEDMEKEFERICRKRILHHYTPIARRRGVPRKTVSSRKALRSKRPVKQNSSGRVPIPRLF